MNAVARILEWPADPEDTLPLALWDARGIAQATGGAASGDFQVSGVEIDSRDVREGDLFFALKGESMDGHRFIEGAFAKGAAACVVARSQLHCQACHEPCSKRVLILWKTSNRLLEKRADLLILDRDQPHPRPGEAERGAREQVPGADPSRQCRGPAKAVARRCLVARAAESIPARVL